MKKILLISFTLITSLSYAQVPINNYFSVPASQFAEVDYADQGASGANVTWNFGTLSQTGTNTDTYAAPTAGELTNYPGTTQVLSITGTTNNQVFHNLTGSTLSLTGASNPDFTLDYNTDNALVGSYPLLYGAASTNDAIAGNITYDGITTTYTGTITTEVDAYGTLSFTVTGQGSYSGTVTRIETIQSLTIFLPGTSFPLADATFTSYNYYKNTDGALVFRSAHSLIVFTPIGGGGSQDFALSEALITNAVSVANNALEDTSIKLYPNPVDDNLNIQLDNAYTMESVRITDINGKIILSSKGHIDTLNVNQLEAGLYIVTIKTNMGSVTKKFIKK